MNDPLLVMLSYFGVVNAVIPAELVVLHKWLQNNPIILHEHDVNIVSERVGPKPEQGPPWFDVETALLERFTALIGELLGEKEPAYQALSSNSLTLVPFKQGILVGNNPRMGIWDSEQEKVFLDRWIAACDPFRFFTAFYHEVFHACDSAIPPWQDFRNGYPQEIILEAEIRERQAEIHLLDKYLPYVEQCGLPEEQRNGVLSRLRGGQQNLPRVLEKLKQQLDSL